MNVEQLVGRYVRLQQELSIARRAQPWHRARIHRLADDVAATERELAALQRGQERRAGPAEAHGLQPGRMAARWPSA